MKRAIAFLAFLLAVTGLIAGSANAATATSASTVRLQALSNSILISLNATRASRNLRPLVVSDDLQRSAAAHSRSMLDRGFFGHDLQYGPPFAVRLKHFYRAAGHDHWSAGENLLYSTSPIEASMAIRSWLDSPSHRANMLNPAWREVGIGSFYASAAGGSFGGKPTWVITMDFGVRSVSRSRKA